MIGQFMFYKENKRWYIDLPSWPGEQCELEMVLGADTFLDSLQSDNSNVKLVLSDEDFKDSRTLEFIEMEPVTGYGAFYITENQHKMWLCDVTRFVFNGEFPRTIYYSVISK